jgi:DNA polymerase III gamma/tau subunit
MSDEAFEVLLNMLEFPADNVTYILCTTEMHRMTKAIRHRCDWYHFKIATPANLIERLSYVNSAEGLEVSEELINLIALRSEGSYREAMMVLEQISSAGIRTVEELNELAGEYDYGPGLIRSATYGPSMALSQLEAVLYHTNPEEVIDRTIETLRDLMILHGNNKLPYTGAALDVRIALARQLDTARILKAMQVIWDLQTKMTNADSVRNLELAFTMIGAALQIVEDKSVVTETPKTMSLDAMRNYGRN